MNEPKTTKRSLVNITMSNGEHFTINIRKGMAKSEVCELIERFAAVMEGK